MSSDDELSTAAADSARRSVSRRLQIGRQYHGYRIDAVLGQGGQGVVYRGWDTTADRPVAVKSLLVDEPTAREHLLREVRSIGRLAHPQIVAVYFATPPESEHFFAVMELIEGCSLAQMIRDEAPLPEAVVLIIAEQVVSGLAHAHGHGVVHLDIKPSNILIDRRTGNVKIADFGMALHDSQRWSQTRGGTIPYMAPEQFLQRTEQFDGRTDLWSVGVVIYEMLTGKRPFGGDPDSTFEQMKQDVLTVQPKPPSQWQSSVSAELDTLCMTCLQKRISDRYGSATRLLDAIRATSPLPSTTEEVVPIPPFAGHGRATIAAGGCLLVLVAAGLALMVACGVVEGVEVRKFLTRLLPRVFK